MSQLNGTALPSLALENLQELENLKLSGSDRDKAEEAIAGVLGSIYSGQYPLRCFYLVETVVPSRDRHRKSMEKYIQTCGHGSFTSSLDCGGHEDVFRGNVALFRRTEESAGRTRFCDRTRPASNFRGSSQVTVH